MLNLNIKGGNDIAQKEATKRNIPIRILRTVHSESSTWTIAETDKANEEKIAKWYCEDDKPPFANGTLLLYTDA